MKFDVKKLENSFEWEEDPLYFIFNNEIPGKVRMHTRKMDSKEWIKIDKTYPAQMQLREELLESKRDKVFVTNHDESTILAKQELLEKIMAYLPERFPNFFEKREGGVYNKILDDFVSSSPDDPDDPLIRAGKLTQEDWVVMEWDEDLQAYKLTAGVVYFPMRWSLNGKWNKGMPGIHKPVKGFMKHLLTNVQSLFKAMTPAAPIWRANWAVFNDLDDIMDLYTPTGHTSRNLVNQTTVFKGEATGKELTFRAEYQTLTKLPESKAIIFSIRTYQRFLEDFKKVPAKDSKGLIKAIENLDPDFHVYKGADFWKDASIKYLQLVIDEKEGRLKSKVSPGLLMSLGGAALACAVVAMVYVSRVK